MINKGVKKGIYVVISILLIQCVSGVFTVDISSSSEIAATDWMVEPDIIVPDDYPTIQSAINNAHSGFCIGIRSGVHHESLIIEGHGLDGLTLIGENRTNAIITADEMMDVDTIIISNADEVTVSNLTITGSGQGRDQNTKRYNNFGVKCFNAANIQISSNIIKDNGNGITCDGESSIDIDGNEIINNKDDGIEGNGKLIITNNNISNNGHGFPPETTNGDGIEIMTSSQASEIINNIISYNGVDGIWDETVDDHLIIDNEIHHNGQSGIHLEEGRDCKIRNNIIYGNGFGEFGKYGAGIYLVQSTSNLIDNNEIFDNKRGIDFRQSHFNELSDNNIYGNKLAGIQLWQTSSNKIFNNNIRENLFGMVLIFASNFKISYNDIYLNDLFGLVSIVSVGGASFNWWGNMFGPYMVKMLRLPPLLTIVTPWSLTRINEESGV